MATARYYRPLGYHERYSLARAQTGFPIIVTLTAKLPFKSDTDSIQALLESRIDHLLLIYPSLSASVIDDRSNQPSFVRKAGPAYTHADILTTKQDLPEDDDDTITSHILSLELNECGEGRKKLLGLQGPMWRVVIRWRPGMTHCWLSISVNHIITDGKGAANLFEILLASDVSKIVPSTPLVDLPPTSDQVFDMKPPIRHVIPIVWHELVLPILPAFTRTRLQGKPHWPANKSVTIEPASAQHMLDLITFDMNTLLQLKRTAQARGIKTVTPLLQIAAFIATSTFVDEDGVSIGTNTPINMRGEAGPHATHCTGNYVSLAGWNVTPASSLAIWPITREYAQLLVNPSTTQNGCWSFGMLSYVPDAMKDPPPTKQIDPIKSDIQSSTSWQHFFEEKMKSETPYTVSFGISNLGIIKVGLKLERLAWAQTAMPVGAAFILDICGYKDTEEDLSGGLSISIGSRKGAVEDGTLLAKRMKNAVSILANVDLVPEEITLKDIVKLVLD